jgi:site-specific DNA-cytosine methylase
LFEPIVVPIAPDERTENDPQPIVIDAHGKRWRFDLLLRPFAVRELAAGQSLPPSYPFAGTASDAKKMIGNAVSVDVAEYLVTAALSDLVAAQVLPSELARLPKTA